MQKWALVAAALAGLTGAGGIILAAVAGHLVTDPRLHAAAYHLIFHASATLAVCGVACALPRRGEWFLGASALFLSGSLLFSGELSLRALAGTGLFPLAAPVGAILLIAGWLVVTLAAVIALRALRSPA